MFNKNLTNDELQCYVPYLKENLPKSIVIYNSVQQEITQKYEIPQTATVLQIDIGDPTPGFVLHRKEGQDNIITIFCPEEKDQLMCDFLANFAAAHNTSPLHIGGVSNSLLPLLKQSPVFKSRRSMGDHDCNILWLDPERSVDNSRPNHEGISNVKVLNASHAKELAESWNPDIVPEAVFPMIKEQLNLGLGRGVFHDGRLVSYAIIMRYGSFGLLQTKESYRKRGYARSVIQDLSKHLESKMIIPYAYVLKTNVASLNLFLSLNFVVSHEDNWLIFNKE